MLHQAQAWLRNLTGALELTVECNPTSNLLIGDLRDIANHPSLRLSAAVATASEGGPAVLFSVNVDDPVTFATRIADEFAHLYCAMLRSGIPAADALDRLERAREAGWRSRFSLQQSREDWA